MVLHVLGRDLRVAFAPDDFGDTNGAEVEGEEGEGGGWGVGD